MRSLILSIYVRSFDPFFWISNKYMASRSSAKSLPFHFHSRLGHNFNRRKRGMARVMSCDCDPLVMDTVSCVTVPDSKVPPPPVFTSASF